eukprot:TRINITY_DN11189_c0_g1_i1.p1 TRINITY_DN11189_c0_g1~~TRINITY_DN11189_c0_g1_i1.p1  ORF type:complete len:615 (+),score=143.69 TRINITY_DN11189_c0_g1_i1:81-1847(+)
MVIRSAATAILVLFLAWCSAQQCSEDSFSIVYAGHTAFTVSNNDSSCTCAGALRSLQGVSYVDTLAVNNLVVANSSTGACQTTCVAPLQAQLWQSQAQIAALNATVLALQLQLATVLSTGCSGGGGGTGACVAVVPPNGLVVGDFLRISDGASINYACGAGYTMSGYTTAKCVGGAFDHPLPVCNPNPCTASAPSFGSVSNTSLPHGGTFTFSCNSGYTLVGSATRTCLLGNVTGTQPTCNPNPCTPTAPQYGTVTPSSVASGGTVTYSCNSGFTMAGTATQSCTTGSLSGVTPTCNPNPCTTAAVPNGGPAVSTIPSGSLVTYYCNPGFPATNGPNNVTATCYAGILNALAPVCSVFASCDAQLTAMPASVSGTYIIDPDGPGGNPAFQVYCEMGGTGGWTLVNVRSTGVAMFAETAYGPLLKTNVPGRVAELWSSTNTVSFRQLRYTNDAGYYATVDFGATTSLNGLNTALSTYTYTYNYAISSTNTVLSYFIMRGQSGTSCAGWSDSCDFAYMAFVNSASISSYGDAWDYNQPWWILSGTDNTYDPATYASPHSGYAPNSGTCHWSTGSTCGTGTIYKPTYVWIK